MRCSFTECRQDATHLVVEAHDLACLFASGAGLVCDTHAKDRALIEQGTVIPLSRDKLLGKACPFCGVEIAA